MALVFSACACTSASWSSTSCQQRDEEGVRWTLCKDEVLEVMKAHHAELQACASTLSEKERGAREIGVKFVVQPDGSTGELKISPQFLTSTSTGHCINAVVSGLRFPPYMHGNIPVSFPIKL